MNTQRADTGRVTGRRIDGGTGDGASFDEREARQGRRPAWRGLGRVTVLKVAVEVVVVIVAVVVVVVVSVVAVVLVTAVVVIGVVVVGLVVVVIIVGDE